MTKGELIKFLEPFTDDINIVARMEYQVNDRAHPVLECKYVKDSSNFGTIVIVVSKFTIEVREL